MNYFISDMHFFHERLLGNSDFSPRLFKNIARMHHQLITSWNAVVKESDHVYHLGTSRCTLSMKKVAQKFFP